MPCEEWEREHRQALCVRAGGSGKGMRSSGGQADSSLPLPVPRSRPGGSDLSVLGGARQRSGWPSHVCRAVAQQV